MNPVSDTANSALVLRTDRAGVACLCLRNPPVNVIHSALRQALHDALDAVERDPAVTGVVVHAEGRMFSGGGEPREIGLPNAADPANMTGLAARIEAFAKPVVAAMHGKAVGGGVLLAMGCHARVASRDASILLPEVNLAFPPGAGGTQRLPRLVGIEVALRMAALAQALDAPTAHAAGFFDELVADDADRVDAAAQRARAIASAALPWRRTCALAVPVTAQADAVAAECRAEAGRLFPGREAPAVAIALVLAAAHTDFEAGMRQERQAYERLANAPEARALIERLLARASAKKS